MTKSLLMIHGVGCTGSAWDAMKPGFEGRGWKCEAPTLFPDLRTEDAPSPELCKLGLKDYILAMSEAAQGLEAETGQKPIVIGHSMGGLIAQKLAERGDVRGAIFLTPAQTSDATLFDPAVLITFANIIFAGAKNLPEKSFKIWKTGFKWGVLNAVPAERHSEIYLSAVHDSGRVYADLSATEAIEDGFGTVDTDKITIPTLTIGAKRDRATVVKAVRRVAEKYSAAPVAGDYMEFPNNAHWIVDEPGTDRVVRDICDWLDQNHL